MRRAFVALLFAAEGALGAVVPVGVQQKPFGLPIPTSTAVRQYMSCAETYGTGWKRCGNQTSRSCFNPALGHSCCSVDNRYCGDGTWCAPVAGYCCLDSEDLDACAKNAGFELPGK